VELDLFIVRTTNHVVKASKPILLKSKSQVTVKLPKSKELSPSMPNTLNRDIDIEGALRGKHLEILDKQR